METNCRLKNLTDNSRMVSVDPNIPIKMYFRSGKEMLKMATIYKDEAAFEKSFILYMKYITLFVEKIREHPEYKDADPDEKQIVKLKCKEIFPIAEKLKEILRKRYEADYCVWLENEKRKEEEEKQRLMQLERDKQLRREREEELRKEELMMKFEEAREKINSGFHAAAIPTGADYSPNQKEMPTVDRSTKPNNLLSFGYEDKLRKIVIPHDLTGKFLEVAKPNTMRDVETCGILAGKLSHNCFTITHVLIPSQKGTSNSCQTEREEAVFQYQDKYDLMTLGWIHTHPSQTAFMSSIDLHTHCSYQLMMSEAIAIVCAPKHDQIGIYSLTPNYGLSFIAKCTEVGFHPHPNDPPLYEECRHIVFDYKSTEVVDLR